MFPLFFICRSGLITGCLDALESRTAPCERRSRLMTREGSTINFWRASRPPVSVDFCVMTSSKAWDVRQRSVKALKGSKRRRYYFFFRVRAQGIRDPHLVVISWCVLCRLSQLHVVLMPFRDENVEYPVHFREWAPEMWRGSSCNFLQVKYDALIAEMTGAVRISETWCKYGCKS